MTMGTNGYDHRKLKKFANAMKALQCWHVNCGGATEPTFSLALGEKIPRSRPLRNPKQKEPFRSFEGEANLYVWCSWRLDGQESPLTSSDDTSTSIRKGLARLVESTVQSVVVTSPAWDLRILFSNELQLHIFCDHVPGDPSFDGNWELWQREAAVFVGPGQQYVIEAKTADTRNG